MMYSGPCLGGPWDGDVHSSLVPMIRGIGFFVDKGAQADMEERALQGDGSLVGWSDRMQVDVVYRWDEERHGWVVPTK